MQVIFTEAVSSKWGGTYKPDTYYSLDLDNATQKLFIKSCLKAGFCELVADEGEDMAFLDDGPSISRPREYAMQTPNVEVAANVKKPASKPKPKPKPPKAQADGNKYPELPGLKTVEVG